MSNTPNLRDRIPQGAGKYISGSYIEAGLPNITGYFDNGDDDETFYGGALHSIYCGHRTENNEQKYGGYHNNRIDFNASWSNPIYGKSDTVQPPALAVNFYIKAK